MDSPAALSGGPGLPPGRLARWGRRPMAGAVLVSLVLHALVLSLTFDGDGHGLPGFDFPWRDRRIEVPELRVWIDPAPVQPAPPVAPPPVEG